VTTITTEAAVGNDNKNVTVATADSKKKTCAVDEQAYQVHCTSLELHENHDKNLQNQVRI